jgi:hypothetical protein
VPFDPTSRYAGLPTGQVTVVDADGNQRVLTYVRRRFVPCAPATSTLVLHAVVQGERLDHLATRYFGDPTQFWRICDANDALRAEELVETPGRLVDIPLPGGL